jgi:hypothetical protein
MKTLFATALIALSATATLPAAAQQVAPGAAAAIAHFNQSIDSANERVRLPQTEVAMRASTRADGALALAFARFNADQDSPSDLRGLNGSTTISNMPAVAQDVFARLRAESAEDE